MLILKNTYIVNLLLLCFKLKASNQHKTFKERVFVIFQDTEGSIQFMQVFLYALTLAQLLSSGEVCKQCI